MKSNAKRKIWLFAILLLSGTLAQSQKVYVDSIQKKTILDEKATIATGNLLKEGKGYKDLFNEQKTLVDSLFVLTNVQRKENDLFRLKIVPNLETLNKEQKNELQFIVERFDLKTELLQSELKNEKRKKWNFFICGGVIGSILTLLAMVL